MPLSAESGNEAIKNFVEADGVRLLVEIMDHPNTDISIGCAANLVKEITDEEQSHLQHVFQELIKCEIIQFIGKMLISAKNSDDESNLMTVYDLLENLLDIDP